MLMSTKLGKKAFPCQKEKMKGLTFSKEIFQTHDDDFKSHLLRKIATTRGFPTEFRNIPRMYLRGKENALLLCLLNWKLVSSQLNNNVQRFHWNLHTISPPTHCSKFILTFEGRFRALSESPEKLRLLFRMNMIKVSSNHMFFVMGCCIFYYHSLVTFDFFIQTKVLM